MRSQLAFISHRQRFDDATTATAFLQQNGFRQIGKHFVNDKNGFARIEPHIKSGFVAIIGAVS